MKRNADLHEKPLTNRFFFHFFICVSMVALCTTPALVAKTASDENRINDDQGTSIQIAPVLAVTPERAALVCWEDQREGKKKIYAQQFGKNGAKIRSNFKIEGYSPAIEQTSPDAAMDALGHFAVVWEEMLGDSFYVFVRLYAFNAQAITATIKVSEGGSAHAHAKPRVAMNERGQFVVCWQSRRVDQMGDVYAQRFESGGRPLGRNFRVNDDTSGNLQAYPRLDIHEDGSFVIVWVDGRWAAPPNSNYVVMIQRYHPDGNPHSGNRIMSVHGEPGVLPTNPDVAIHTNGNFYVCWSFGTFGAEGIYGTLISPNLVSLKPPALISASGGIEPVASCQRPQVCLYHEEYYSVIWDATVAAQCNVYRIFVNMQGETAGSKAIISEPQLNTQKSAAAHYNCAGGLTLYVWQDNRHGEWDIYGTYHGGVMAHNVFAGSGFNGLVPLSWDQPYGTPGGTRYRIIREKEDLSESVLIGIVDPNARGAAGYLMRDLVDPTLTNGHIYRYGIQTEDSSGFFGGVYSNYVTPTASGHSIESHWAEVVPTVDGVVAAGEWDTDAYSTTISAANSIFEAVVLYVKNDENTLYVAVSDPNDKWLNPANVLGILWDQDHSRTWPAHATSGEGLFTISSASTLFTGFWGTYPDGLGADQPQPAQGVVASISAGSGCVQYEMALTRAGLAGTTVGFSVWIDDPSNFWPIQYGYAGHWPLGALWEAAETLGDLHLAVDPATAVAGEMGSAVKEFALGSGYPNPFNASTCIPYVLAAPCEVTLTIHDIRGRIVTILVQEQQTAGEKRIVWDGRDARGETVCSGLYFYVLEAGEFTARGKAALIR